LPELLYLDTARQGRMSPAAQRAQHDFVSLAGEEGNSAYAECFVRRGLAACPTTMQERYPGLATWQGVSELKQSLRTLAGHRSDLPVLVAHRTTQLMNLAARALFHSCRNVLVTDLGWPGYHEILEHEARRANRLVTVVSVRDDVLAGHLCEAELIERVCAVFARERCDGVFMSAVSNWGVRLPVEQIVRRLETAHRVWFVAVDGAQGFCHTPGQLETEYCDLYLTGCHKWMRAYHPMGLGFYGRPRSCKAINAIRADMTKTGALDDPLLRFAALLEACETGVTETVNLLPLFTTRGAVEDARLDGATFHRAENMRVAVEVARTTGWRPLLPDEPLRSGILLLEAERLALRSVCPEALRATLRDSGVAATAYEGGLVRLSMPSVAFTTD
jgi:selenocysteine lyase/cysteine desulfurase